MEESNIILDFSLYIFGLVIFITWIVVALAKNGIIDKLEFGLLVSTLAFWFMFCSEHAGHANYSEGKWAIVIGAIITFVTGKVIGNIKNENRG